MISANEPIAASPGTSLKDDKIARAMRDSVMEQRSSDENWHACRRSWNKSLELFKGRLAEMGLEIRPMKNL
jgi:hypothetical protein